MSCAACGQPKLAHNLCPSCYSQLSKGFKAEARGDSGRGIGLGTGLGVDAHWGWNMKWSNFDCLQVVSSRWKWQLVNNRNNCLLFQSVVSVEPSHGNLGGLCRPRWIHMGTPCLVYKRPFYFALCWQAQSVVWEYMMCLHLSIHDVLHSTAGLTIFGPLRILWVIRFERLHHHLGHRKNSLLFMGSSYNL